MQRADRFQRLEAKAGRRSWAVGSVASVWRSECTVELGVEGVACGVRLRIGRALVEG